MATGIFYDLEELFILVLLLSSFNFENVYLD
jgi:hypothetical protein